MFKTLGTTVGLVAFTLLVSIARDPAKPDEVAEQIARGRHLNGGAVLVAKLENRDDVTEGELVKVTAALDDLELRTATHSAAPAVVVEAER
jgi:flagella basal body P-ring formation protein FlgA